MSQGIEITIGMDTGVPREATCPCGATWSSLLNTQTLASWAELHRGHATPRPAPELQAEIEAITALLGNVQAVLGDMGMGTALARPGRGDVLSQLDIAGLMGARQALQWVLNPQADRPLDWNTPLRGSLHPRELGEAEDGAEGNGQPDATPPGAAPPSATAERAGRRRDWA